MSERIRFFKSGAMLTAVALAMRTAAMLFGAFVSRTVGAEGTGLYTVIMTVYSFALTFATSGISLTVTRLVASAIGEGRAERVGRIFRSALIYSLCFGLFSTFLLFFGANFIGKFILNDARTVLSLKVLAFSLVPVSLGSVVGGYFVGVRRVGFNAASQVLGQMLKIFVTVILVVRLSAGGVESCVMALCLGITLTEILGFLIQILCFAYDRYKYARAVRRSQSRELGAVAKTALPLAFSAYVRAALLSLEHILIPKRLTDGGESSSEAYSNYGLLHGMALPVILYPMTPLSSFSGLLVPEFANDISAGKHDRMSRVASEALGATLVYASVSAVILYSFSEELGYVIYGSYEAGYYIRALAPVVPIMYLDHVTDSMLKGIGEQVFSMWVNITDSVLSIALVWLLIPKMGILGYAVVIVVMEGYNFALSFFRLRKKIKFKINLFKSLGEPLLASFIATFITNALFDFSGRHVPLLWLIMKIIFSLAAVVFILTLTRVKIGKKQMAT